MLIFLCLAFSGNGKTAQDFLMCDLVLQRNVGCPYPPTVSCAVIFSSFPTYSAVLSILGLNNCALEQSLSQNHRFSFFKAFENSLLQFQGL